MVGGGMTHDQDRTHLALWAITANKLLISVDPRKMSPAAIALISNPEVIAIDQDPLKLQGQRILAFLERPLVTPALFGLQLGLAWGIGGGAGLLWLWALHLGLTNSSWAVNSICHGAAFGRAPHDTGEGSRDVPWLAAFTLGEAYHNTHHRYPRSARHGLEGFDPSWTVITVLVRLGLASEPWLPRAARGEGRPAVK